MDHAHRYISEEEYLDLEEMSPIKHEWKDGVMTAMSGAAPRHDAVNVSILGTFIQQFRGTGCRIHSSDMRVVCPSGRYTYPDISLVCRPPDYKPTRPPSIANPTVLVEVLSPSTRAYDLGAKLADYQTIGTLEAVLFVDPEARTYELVVRRDGAWTRQSGLAGAAVVLHGVEFDTSTWFEDLEGLP